MGSALLNTTTEREFGEVASTDVLRMQVAERLAEHRRRRTGTRASAPRAAEPLRSVNLRSARIAAAVAERYAHTPSYRAFLAAEAERAIEQARAAAEVAAMNAQAIAEAQQRMLDAFDAEAAERARHEEAQIARTQRVAADAIGAAEDEFGDAPAAALQQRSAIELNLWPDHVRDEARRESAATRRTVERIAATGLRAGSAGGEVVKAASAASVRPAGLTVRLYQDAGGAAHEYLGVTHRAPVPAHTNRREYRNDAEAMALDEEIAFRQAPIFEEPAGPPVPLPANLIEFPRQLVASRKARPRLAEGPLREEREGTPGDGQLRIFEVDTAQIRTLPEEPGADTPQWTSIWLDAPAGTAKIGACSDFAHELDPHGEVLAEPCGRSVPAVQAASIARRVTAGGIDVAIVVAGVLAFAATAVEVFSRFMSWHIAWGHAGGSMLQTLRVLATSIASETGVQPGEVAVIAAVAGGFLILMYQALFFWFSSATPGMRCARIALCTFDDDNPTRRAVRRRLAAMLLSACALGLGFMWALLDEDRLTWHDRITRMYLRSY